MVIHLYDNTTWTGYTTYSSGQRLSIGVRFGVTAPQRVLALRYLKTAANSLDHVSALHLYQLGVTTPVKSITSIPNDGTTGWKELALTTPYSLITGQTYMVVGDYETGAQHAYLPRGSVNPPPSPALWDDNITTYLSNAWGYPTTVENANPRPIDVTLEVDPGSGGSGGDAATPADLAEWLSTDGAVQTHETDGLPWRTDTTALDIAAAVKGTGAYTELGVFPRLTNIAALIAYLTSIVENIAGIVTNIQGWFSAPARPVGQDAIDAILNRIDLGVIALQAGNGGGEWADGRVLAPDQHELDATFPFAGQVGWGSGRALHRVHIDTTDDRHPFIDLGAAGWWVPGVGWWAATLPDGSLTNRTPLEFADQWLWPVPAAATGVILWCHPSVTGYLESYAVPPATP